MSEFEIHSDPVPKMTRGRPFGSISKNRKYPFDKLEVGQNVYIPLREGRNPNDMQSQLIYIAKCYTKGLGRKFTTRFIPEKNAIGVWRVE